MSDDWRSRAKKLPKGHLFEDFSLGQVFQHHWGRTLNEGDNTLFSTLTLSYNPLYFNEPYARAHGHPTSPVNPMLVFATVFGLSVEDLSEAGGLFLGGMIMQGATADLAARDPNLAAVFLQHACRGQVGLRKKHIGGTSGE